MKKLKEFIEKIGERNLVNVIKAFAINVIIMTCWGTVCNPSYGGFMASSLISLFITIGLDLFKTGEDPNAPILKPLLCYIIGTIIGTILSLIIFM